MGILLFHFKLPTNDIMMKVKDTGKCDGNPFFVDMQSRGKTTQRETKILSVGLTDSDHSLTVIKKVEQCQQLQVS